MYKDNTISSTFIGYHPLFSSSKTTLNQAENGMILELNFTGKETDCETGYSYFGARYYDPTLLTSWTAVDPMADKYPSLSPYNYCAWNPMKVIDPDGRDTVYVNRNGTEHERRPGGNSTFIYTNNKWNEVPMPGIITERCQSQENTSGEEYQKYDHLIAAATGYFNADKNAGTLQLYTDGNNPIPKSSLSNIPDLDPTLVKAIAIQESNCGKRTMDILQANNVGDWAPFKSKYGFTKGKTPQIWQSLIGGIKILTTKGYKGGVSGNGEFRFQGWMSAVKAYNGGGNKEYVKYVKTMYQKAVKQ